MKTAIVQRLWKEARALLPAWAATSLLIVGSFALFVLLPAPITTLIGIGDDIFDLASGLRYALGTAAYAYAFGAALMGATCFGCEFSHRTMGALLVQPVARLRIWWEKMAVLAIALLVSGALLFWLGFATISIEQDLLSLAIPDMGGANNLFQDSLDANQFLQTPPGIGLLVLLLAMIGFCTGPALTLLTRSTIAGTLLTLLCPWTLALLCGWLPPMGMAYGTIYWIAAQGLCCPILFLVGCWRFQRLEDTPASTLDLSMPAFLSTGMSWLPIKLRSSGTGASVLTNLVKKELRLQWPAFLLAVLIIVYGLASVAERSARQGGYAEFLFLFCLGIPALAGIVIVAEERNLRVHEWHLTLPVSSRRQWLIKVLVAIAVNGLLGLALPYIALPYILAYTVEWRLGRSIVLLPFVGFSIMNVSIICCAIYASSISANCLRALLWTIVFLIPIVPVIGLLAWPVINFRVGVDQPHWAVFALSAAGFLVLFGAVFEMGLARFRRAHG